MHSGVYELLADSDVQVRGRFQLQATKCSSSDERKIDIQFREDSGGLRLGELGVQSKFGERFRVATSDGGGNGSSNAGLEVSLDGRILKVGAWMMLMSNESPSLEQIRRPLQAVARNSSHSASIAVGEWELHMSSFDFSFGRESHIRLQLLRWRRRPRLERSRKGQRAARADRPTHAHDPTWRVAAGARGGQRPRARLRRHR
jgi:hypothetical protein